MVPQIATAVCALGIAGLFVFDHDPRRRISKALWLPIVWLFIGGSRNVGEWLHFGGSVDPNDRYLEGNPLDRTVLTAILVLGLVVLIGKRQQIGTLLRANVPIVLYFVYCGISIFWSDYPYVAFKRWNRGLGDLVMVLIILSDRDWLSALPRVLARTGFLLVPLSVLFVRYFPELGRSFSRYEGRTFFTGVSTDKNGLGMVCLIFGLSSLWCFLSAYQGQKKAQRRRRLVAHGVILAMVVWLSIKADSATSVACLLLAGGLMVVTSLRALAGKTALVHAFVVAAVAFTLYAVFLDTGGSLVGTLGRDPTLTGRTAVWKLVTNYASSPLFGTGFESFWLGERLDNILSIIPGLNEAHNGYLEIYLNLGWVGVALLALLTVVGYRNVVHTLRRDPEIGRLRLAYFAVGMVYNLTEAGFKMMSPIWITFLLSTMAVPIRKQVGKLRPSGERNPVGNKLDNNRGATPIIEGAGSGRQIDFPTEGLPVASAERYEIREEVW